MVQDAAVPQDELAISNLVINAYQLHCCRDWRLSDAIVIIKSRPK